VSVKEIYLYPLEDGDMQVTTTSHGISEYVHALGKHLNSIPHCYGHPNMKAMVTVSLDWLLALETEYCWRVNYRDLHGGIYQATYTLNRWAESEESLGYPTRFERVLDDTL
jgi:hypothetical protein